ncbi:MAG: methionyl-tRNA formyltransferase [Hyphomicrobiales bacterium]|nr:methionyl-tRNA formyltransferase [Hyphomicrobiales bacterium]
MRIVVHGQEAFGKAVLEALLERGENIVGVYCAPDKEGRPPDPLKVFAEEKGFEVHQPASWKSQEVWEHLKSLEPDLGVMAFVTLFVPQAALDIPKLGTIQYHPSLLPLHRGPSSINWPIIMGRKKTGLSIFWPDEGLDEGPILMQKEVEIGPDDTLGTIYFNNLFPLGVEALCESVDLVREGKAPKIEQDHSKKTYESWCKTSDAEIDWSKPVEEVHNLIRGTDPAPGAWTKNGDQVVQLYDSTRVQGEGAPGEVLAVSDDGIAIAAEGGAVRVGRMRAAKEKKIPANEYAANAGLKAGDRLG